ncbi:MAG: hypothetical protein GY861_06430 [bacterium]|nr:hypothetical protein [bacterium]
MEKNQEDLKKEIEMFRHSMNDWILFLNNDVRESKMRLREMERRVRFLEAEKRLKL